MLLLICAGLNMGASSAQQPFLSGVYYVWAEPARLLVWSEVTRTLTWSEPA